MILVFSFIGDFWIQMQENTLLSPSAVHFSRKERLMLVWWILTYVQKYPVRYLTEIGIWYLF